MFRYVQPGFSSLQVQCAFSATCPSAQQNYVKSLISFWGGIFLSLIVRSHYHCDFSVAHRAMQFARGTERIRIMAIRCQACYEYASEPQRVFNESLLFVLFQWMSEPQGKGRTCNRSRVGFSTAGDLLLWGTNPFKTQHHMSSTRTRGTEPTDASGSP